MSSEMNPSSARVDMTGDVQQSNVSSSSPPPPPPDDSELEARRERVAKRAEEERKAKMSGEQSSKRSKGSRPGAHKATRAPRTKKEEKAKVKPASTADDEKEARQKRLAKRAEEEQKAKRSGQKSSNRSRAKRPGAQKATRTPRTKKEERNKTSPPAAPVPAPVATTSDGAVIAATAEEDTRTRQLEETLQRQQIQISSQQQQMANMANMVRQREEEQQLARRRQKEEEERQRQALEDEKREKDKRCKRICWGLLVLVLLGGIAGLVVAFALPKKNEDESQTNPTEPPTIGGGGGGNGLFEPPTKEDCEAIANADESYFDDYSDRKEVDVVVEAIFQNESDIDTLFPIIEQSLQRNLLPYLAGCTQETRRRLRDLQKYRLLENLSNIVAFANFLESIQDGGVCTTSSDPSCKRMATKLDLSLKGEVSCDELLNHVNGMLKEVPEKLPNLLLGIGFKSISFISGLTCTRSGTKIEPTAFPTTKEPTKSPSEEPTRAPVVGTFPPTKATPRPTNVPTKAPTPEPTCVAVESLYEEVLDVEPQEDKDELSYTLECPKDFLDLVVLAKASVEEDGDCEVTCLGHVTADATEEGCTDNGEEEYSVILETGDLVLEDLVLFIGYVNEALPQDLECPDEFLVLSTKAPTAIPTPLPTPQPTTPAPTLAPTTIRSTLEDLLLKYFDNPLHSDALTWLANVDTWLPSEGTKTTIVTGPNGGDQSLWEALWVERYALAVFYHETNGNGWTKKDSWLSDQSVCDWYYEFPACNANGQIVELRLSKS